MKTRFRSSLPPADKGEAVARRLSRKMSRLGIGHAVTTRGLRLPLSIRFGADRTLYVIRETGEVLG